MSIETEVMPERDYLFTIAEEVMYSVEVAESLADIVSLEGFSDEENEVFLKAVKNIVRPEDKYFLCNIGLHNGCGSGEHIDTFLYAGRFSKDPNLRYISSGILYTDFLSVDSKLEREKWVAALNEVGGKFGFYCGDREFDVVLKEGVALDSPGLERIVASL
jgi:hypothetical protein